MEKLTEQSLQEKIDNLDFDQRFCLTNVPDSLYHGSEGVGSTAMKSAVKSMAHFQEYMNGQSYSDTTLKAFTLGSAVHTLVLEPELFNDRYVMQPPSIKVRRGKDWEAFKAANRDKEILSSNDLALARRMSETTIQLCGRFFSGGSSEKSYWYRHPCGMVLKARIDYEIGDAAIDLKTTIADTPEKFAKVVKYDYAVQDSLYRLVSGLPDMLYVGVCKAPPHSIFLCKQGEDVRERADHMVELTIDSLLDADMNDSWPNMPVELIETELSAWESNNGV